MGRRPCKFDSNARRVANREGLHALIDAVFSQLPIDQVIARLDRAQIANARMNEMQEFWDYRSYRHASAGARSALPSDRPKQANKKEEHTYGNERGLARPLL